MLGKTFCLGQQNGCYTADTNLQIVVSERTTKHFVVQKQKIFSVQCKLPFYCFSNK